MQYLSYLLFVIGLACYLTALFFIGDNTGETLSDIGNAIMLINAGLLLLRLNRNKSREKETT
ncbi:hypothetical protein K9N50_05460 [bacterium]|nr:hypothetical protein [bacterium]